jgi:hypothetical protein
MTIRRIWLGASLALAVAGAAPAHAETHGNALIESVQVRESLVVLNGKPFRVGEHTAIAGKGNKRLTLAELPSTDRGATMDQAAVYYEADDETQGAPLLYRLELTGAVPR